MVKKESSLVVIFKTCTSEPLQLFNEKLTMYLTFMSKYHP